jgi:hypothetical protein
LGEKFAIGWSMYGQFWSDDGGCFRASCQPSTPFPVSPLFGDMHCYAHDGSVPPHFSGSLMRRPGKNRNSILYFILWENNAVTSDLYASKNWCHVCMDIRIHICMCMYPHMNIRTCLFGLYLVKCISLIYSNLWSAGLKYKLINDPSDIL